MSFTRDSIDFLSQLELNNDRDWFQPRKADFEELVRGPMAAVVERVNAFLADTGPEYVTEPQKAIYRIYRDTRFSKDKHPYKTHIGALFPHRALGKNGGAALYFHVSPKEFLVAGGVYKCEPPLLLAIRQYIAEQHERLTAILKSRSVKQTFGELQGDQLTRPPKGWSADHPAIDYLRRKDLLLEVALQPEAAFGAKGVNEVTKRFGAMLPFVAFLNEPLLAQKKRAVRDPLLVRGR